MDDKGEEGRGAEKAQADARSAAERRIALELEIQHLKARVAALKDDIDALERHLES